MALVPPPLPAGLSDIHRSDVAGIPPRRCLHHLDPAMPSMPFPLPDPGAVAQELALLARTGDHPLFAAVGDRCGREPASRSLWHRFIAQPGSQMAALATWLQAELDRHPGFARDMASLWHQWQLKQGRLPSPAQPTPALPAGTRSRDRDHGSAMPLLHALPTGIRNLWTVGVGPEITDSLVAFVTREHREQELPARGRILAEHMAHYLRLSGQPDSGDDQTPRYHDRLLLDLLEEHLALDTEAPRVRSTRNGTPPPVPEPVPAAKQPRKDTLTRHAELECPDRVWIGTPLVPIMVRLLAPDPDDPAARLAMELQPDLPIHIWLTAPGFDVLGSQLYTLWLEPDAPRQEITFELQPRTAGAAHLMVQFLQEGTPLGSIMARIEIEEQVTTTVKNRFVRADHLAVGDKSESPDLTLFVHYDMMQAQPRLLFNLYRDGQLSESWPPAVLHADTRSYHAEIYQRLSDLTDVFDIQRDSPDTMEAVDRQLRSLGQSLWNDLIPEGLQQLYALERAEWHGRSLLVVTDEPHIPWELMWPYGYQGESWEDEQPWCMSMRMTRWLHQDGEGAGLHGPPSQLEIERFAFAGPSDMSLAAIETEGQQLRTLMQTAGIAEAGPDLGSLARIQALLESGDYDWLHLASHGEFSAERPDTGSAILLEGGEALAPDALIGPQVQGHIFRQRPSFVLNACHAGRQGWALTQLGGWVNRLVGSGAGLFVGPLWTVTDSSAQLFAVQFYERLLAGNTVSEALHAARRQIRELGDPTWLAYSAYAHPNARLTRTAGPGSGQSQAPFMDETDRSLPNGGNLGA